MNRDAIRRLIPHDGAMCLLDGVTTWDENHIHCHSLTHRDADNPLRRHNHLSAIHLVEYAAQAAALHQGLVHSATGTQHEASAASGALAALRNLDFTVSRIDAITQPLQIHAHNVLSGPVGLIYDFSVTVEAKALGSGQLTIVTQARQ